MNSLVKTGLLAAALLAPPSASETVLGVYVFHRHGDRTSKSTPPTRMTALGADQVFRSGQHIRSLYVASNASSRISGLTPDVLSAPQLSLLSPVDAVLQNSAQVFAQALYPPTAAAGETLADGSRVQAPLGGYQYLPVEAAATTASGAEDTAWLQGASGCGRAVASSNGYFASAEYLATLESTRGFYRDLMPAINRTFSADAANFKNGYAIYDLLNVAQIHNASYPGKPLITPSTLHQLSTRADQHEWGLAFNASDPVRAIAGAVLAGHVLRALNATLLTTLSLAGASSTAPAPPLLNIQFGAYGTFASFFGLARLHELSPDFTGIVRYASSLVFELVTNSSTTSTDNEDAVGVRFRFANGTAGENNPLVAYPLFGAADTVMPWRQFAREMGRVAVADTTHWCEVCGGTTGICAASGSGAGPSSQGSGGGGGGSSGGNGTSLPVAGVIGALVTLVVVLGLQGLVMALAGLRVVKKRAVGGVDSASDNKATA